MRYILYCRKSTDTEDRQVLSLESQEKELLDLASSLALKVVKVLHESKSAKAEGRPVFSSLLASIQTGEADAVLCWKLDRLARNMADAGRVIDLLQRGVIKEIRTHDALHLPTDNVLMLAVQLGMANQYIRDLSENVKRGNRAKLERGEWPNKAPFGYLNDNATKSVIIDPDRSRYVRRTFELYLSGSHSFASISDLLYSEGLRTSSGRKVLKSYVQRILTSRFYTGVMERGGKLYEGNHQALISKKAFDEAQAIMSGASRPRAKTDTTLFPLRGFLKCESCGCMLTASLKKGHQYYYCTNGRGSCDAHKTYLRENALYELVGDLFASLHFSERKIELMYEAARARVDHDGSEMKLGVANLTNRLNALPERESRLLDAFLGQQITKELFDQKSAEMKHERLDIQNQIKQLESSSPVFTLEPTKEVFLQGSRATKEFLDADEAKKRNIVEKLLWNLTIENGKVAQIQFKSPYHVLAKAPKNADFHSMLAVWDSNPTPTPL